eukprot:tig00000718_g3740.t1
MRWIDDPTLSALNSELRANLVDSRLTGRLEVYSCKQASGEKQLAAKIESKIESELATSPEPLLVSPLGSLTDAANRKVLINLIATLNASFPDYDFSNVKPEQFTKEPDLRMVINHVNASLAEAFDRNGSGLCERLWAAIFEVIQPDECSIYSYLPDLDSDPLSEGKLWSFNYFFYNKRKRKVIFFTCTSKSKLAPNSDAEESTEDEDGERMSEDDGADDVKEGGYMSVEEMDD